jgi:small subunit ribosomal protein S16
MRTVVRLKRVGRRKRPVFRLVAMSASSRRDGAPLEILGWVDRIRDLYHVNVERARYWSGVGAQFSEAAAALMKRAESEQSQSAATA